ncbi:MAG: hypothetical protein O9275_20670 [Microcystis sp. LE19-196.1B]|nr:hypothetical protein [Microcystis sp. LE19-196.1B]
MEFKDYLTLSFSLIALILSIYNAFIGPRFQLSLHIMKLISDRAKEINKILSMDFIENSKNIKECITISVRSIQLIEKFEEDYAYRLSNTKKIFLTNLYLEINDYIHNLFLNDLSEPIQIVEKYHLDESDQGKKIISDQISFIRKNFINIHNKYSKSIKYKM